MVDFARFLHPGVLIVGPKEEHMMMVSKEIRGSGSGSDTHWALLEGLLQLLDEVCEGLGKHIARRN